MSNMEKHFWMLAVYYLCAGVGYMLSTIWHERHIPREFGLLETISQRFLLILFWLPDVIRCFRGTPPPGVK